MNVIMIFWNIAGRKINDRDMDQLKIKIKSQTYVVI